MTHSTEPVAKRATPANPMPGPTIDRSIPSPERRNLPLASVEIQHMLAGSGALPSSRRRPLAASIARLRTRNGAERIDA